MRSASTSRSHLAAAGAERQPHAELPRPLGDAVGHRPVEPDRSQQQRQQPEPGGEQREHPFAHERGADLRGQWLRLEGRARHRGADDRLDGPRQRGGPAGASHEQMPPLLVGELRVGEIDGEPSGSRSPLLRVSSATPTIVN